MSDWDRTGEDRTERRPDPRERRERTVAPPIEREHETQQGIFEEDEKRERQGVLEEDEKRDPEHEKRDPERR
ncbi:MAG TPA: hypothetical protein VFL83_03080 [Anaeromyxobacter sp.]|nr:hypothetical protein [Anaeromyxobacter sp.]